MNNLELVNEKPIVSIIIPCFNSESYIAECIESVIEQDYENIEVIVVDDGSTDNSAEIISKYKDVSLYKQENSGACVARNYGLSKSNGKYIKFLDSDDFLEIGVIKKQVEQAEDLDNNTIVYGDYYLLRGRKKKIQNTFLNKSEQTALLIVNDILTATPLHRKWMLEKVKGFDDRFKNGQEWNLHVRLSSEGFCFHHMKIPVYNYRVHDSASRISNNRNNGIQDIIYSIEKSNLTSQRLGYKCSGDVKAAFALRYWWNARSFYNKKENDLALEYINKSRFLTCNYKRYWPLYYRFFNLFFGFKISELIITRIKTFLKSKYI